MRSTIPSWIIWGCAAIGCSTLASSAASSPVQTSQHSPRKIDPYSCDCFTVAGKDPGYFQHYKLWDFRAVPLSKHSHTFPLDPDDPNDPDDDTDDGFEDGDEDADEDEGDGDEGEGEGDKDEDEGDEVDEPNSSSLYFFKTAFDKDWISQQWRRTRGPNSPVAMVNSKRNVFFTRDHDHWDTNATHLVLRTTRFHNYTSTAEIETRVHNIYRCSLRVRLRIMPANVLIAQPPLAQEWPPVDPLKHPIPALNNVTCMANNTSVEVKPPSGACVGVFTYHSRNCESDIEILTSDPPHRVRYANQPDYDPVTDQMIPGASTIADLPVLWTSWSTHRLDWHSDRSRWYVDNIVQDSKSYRVPNLQSRLVINLWSDGGVWTGDMKLGDSVYVGIEYIELAYNRSSDGSDGMAIPPSQRHGGHQVAALNVSTPDIDAADGHTFEPATEIVTGARKKCKKGRKGRKCRKKQKKGRKGHKDKEPDVKRSCHRPCDIDADWFAHPQ